MLAIEGTTPYSNKDASDLEITFNQKNICSAAPHSDDPVVISIQTGELLVRKVLLDPGSSADVLFYTTFLKMKISKKLIQPSSGELVGFSGERVPIKGYIWLKTMMENHPLSRTIDTQYLIVDCPSPYNIILGRPALNILKKSAPRPEFPQEVKAIHNTTEVLSLAELDPREDTQERPQPADELQKVPLTEKPEQVTYIGQALQRRERSELVKVLQDNTDLFAWTPADMPGIDPNIICHKLATNKTSRPVSQKKRNLRAEKSKAALEETEKLLKAKFIKEIRFTTWISNVVMSNAIWSKECRRNLPTTDGQGVPSPNRWNMEIYVDDMVAKTTHERSHCDDLKEIFEQLRAYKMRLNPEKYAFGVQGGKFLGFMLTSRGIEANPEKYEAILNMTSPKTIKEVQQLAGRIAALSRFLPSASSRSYHFFQTITKNKKFQWIEECEKAFAELKSILSSPPVPQRPEVGKPLYLYLSISNFSISSALVIETGKTQQPSHTIIVRTNQPLRQILTKPELAGRLTKWSIELSEFDIQFQPRLALKAQILADFISELTSDKHNKCWELHVDGASSRGGSGAGIILKEGDNVVAEQSLQFHFPASNKQAEYEALIAGLKLALNLQIQSLTAHCDFLLVVQQIRGEYQVKDPLLERYWLIAKDLISKFSSFIILHVHREKNVRADILSKLFATRADTQTSALSQLTLKKPSIELLSITNINHLHDWRTPFLEHINTGTVPKDELNPQHFRRRASLYTSIEGELYKRGISQPLLKCLNTEEAREVMDEVHEGVCGNHIGGRALAAKIVRTGYFWPTMKRDCITKVKTCDKCQKHEVVSTKPAEVLHSMEHHFSSVEHPQTNGQAEAANRVILQAIKRKLDNAKGEWAELIPEVLWSYNTTIQTNTGETPFKLVYGTEALIPVEVGAPTIRTELYDEQHNTHIRNAELDLVEEDRDIAAIKQRTMKELAVR
ncbi:uncharacterized protein [Arachis hypogaea]|uniref:uncharacterized protein n=1 Tax=Arachis hypogaea TaxID=3818 RepID=UPI003B20BBEC